MNLQLLKQLEQATMAELYSLAYTDPLTGIGNRRAFEADDREWVLLIDLDSFKWINDTFGHAIGDQHLVEVAATLAEFFGKDNCYRIGGDEFAVKGDVHAVLCWYATHFSRPAPEGSIFQQASMAAGEGTDKADLSLFDCKANRTEAGQRAPRGEAPPWADQFYARFEPINGDRRANRE